MKIRRLEIKDAVYMLEWMKDEELVKNMHTDFSDKSLEDCIDFIKCSWKVAKCVHWAVADEQDEYMGTVSLKNIETDKAEFAVAMRRCAMGRGYAKYAMKECVQYAFRNLGLKKVYWYVASNNERAIRFYDKNGYQEYDGGIEKDTVNAEKNIEYKWYVAYNGSMKGYKYETGKKKDRTDNKLVSN